MTLHNLGFLAADRLAEANGIRITRKDSKALLGSGVIGGKAALVAKPQTFMNLSGTSVRPLLEKYSVPAEKLVLIYDDSDLPWTAVRIRPGGSSGGHHGVESVIKSVGNAEFPRVRLGIRPDHPIRHGADFVLSPLRKAQFEELDELLDHTARAVESLIADGVQLAMTKYNRRARGVTQEEK